MHILGSLINRASTGAQGSQTDYSLNKNIDKHHTLPSPKKIDWQADICLQIQTSNNLSQTFQLNHRPVTESNTQGCPSFQNRIFNAHKTSLRLKFSGHPHLSVVSHELLSSKSKVSTYI